MEEAGDCQVPVSDDEDPKQGRSDRHAKQGGASPYPLGAGPGLLDMLCRGHSTYCLLTVGTFVQASMSSLSYRLVTIMTHIYHVFAFG